MQFQVKHIYKVRSAKHNMDFDLRIEAIKRGGRKKRESVFTLVLMLSQS